MLACLSVSAMWRRFVLGRKSGNIESPCTKLWGKRSLLPVNWQKPMFIAREATMKRSLLTALALLVILFPATVCKASDAKSDRYQRVGDKLWYNFDDGTCGDSIGNGSMKVHNFSLEICGDPTRIENMAFDDVDAGTSGPFTKIGGTILYNFDW